MKAICYICGKEFNRKPALIKRAKHPTCSNECRSKVYEKQKARLICSYCGEEFEAKKHCQTLTEIHFCCKEHQGLYISKTQHKDKVEIECPICKKKFKVYPYRLELRDVICCSRKCATTYQLRDRTKHWHYNENLTDEERIKRRKLKENAQWRQKVFERDNYNCDICGQHGGKLQAHHLNGYSWDIKNRLNVKNGITLCEKHHKEFHKLYGHNKNTKSQYLEYANQTRRLYKV